MTSLAVAMWFGMFAVQTDKSEVGDAAKKIAESKSYSWKGSLKFEGQLPFGGGGGGGGGADIPEQTFSGSFEDGVGSHILTDASEFISVGDKSVTRPRGEWRMVEAPGGGGGGGGGFTSTSSIGMTSSSSGRGASHAMASTATTTATCSPPDTSPASDLRPRPSGSGSAMPGKAIVAAPDRGAVPRRRRLSGVDRAGRRRTWMAA